MAQGIPIVRENTLIYQLKGQPHELKVGDLEWYAWLASASAFAFSGPSGRFTARKERAGNKRGGCYWKAYRKYGGRLFSAYLGKSETLTTERLNAVAATLVREDGTEHQEKDTDVPAITSASQPYSTQPEQERAGSRSFTLPTPLTSLIGREQDIANVCALLRNPEVRLLTLIGTGGVGKTRLALQVATKLQNDFIDGVVFVSLASTSDPSLVMPTIAQTLGLREAGQLPVSKRVEAFLHEKHLLLILDNFEHVVHAAPRVEELLVACPRLKVLITSRTALHLQGDREFPVIPLALPDPAQYPADDNLVQYPAVALFVQRAQAILPAFQVTPSNFRTIAAICARLDGLPLAIELAAARVKLFPPQALLTRLSQRLRVLTGGARTLPERQRTLHNTLQWSYDLLSPDEQRLFRLLSIFVGGCTLETLEAVCHRAGDTSIDVLNVAASLLDHSLVQQVNQEGEDPRLTMLETVREYAWECLVASRESEESERTYALYYLDFAEEAAPNLRGGRQQLLWLGRLQAEQENLRAALHFFTMHREAELALRLSGALWWYWVSRGSFSEGRTFLEEALALPHSGVPTEARAWVLGATGELALRQGNYTVASSLLTESVASFQELANTRGLAQAVLNLGLVRAYQHDFASARTLMEQSIALCREMMDKWLLGHALDSLARLAWKQGDIETTYALSLESMLIGREMGETRAQISPRKLLASVAMARGDYTQVATLAQELLAIARQVGDRESEFSALFTLGTSALRQGDDTQALTFYQRSLSIADETGNARNRSMVLSHLGELAYRQGNNTQALDLYQESLSLSGVFEDQEVIGVALLGLARVARAEGQHNLAAHLLGAAEARMNVNIDLDPIARDAYERDLAALQTYLGEEAFREKRDEGSRMTTEQLLAAPLSTPAAKRPAPPVYPDGLTAREADVLRLVASGLTDTQVADKLVISPRTVQGHLRSIYSKIHVNSRSAATRYAVERRLV